MTSEGEVLKSITDLFLREEVAEAWERDEANREAGLPASTPMPADDPAQWLLADDFHSTPTVYDEHCYICNDPEFARMGLPLCWACEKCGAHIAADDGPDCPACGWDHDGGGYVDEEEA